MGADQEQIRSRLGVDWEQLPLYSEPLIGSERSHDFRRGYAPDPLPIPSLF